MLGLRHLVVRSYLGMDTVFLVFWQCQGLLVRSMHFHKYLRISIFVFFG